MRSPDYNKEFVLNFGVGGSGCLTVLGESPDFLFPPRSFLAHRPNRSRLSLQIGYTPADEVREILDSGL